MRHRVRSLVALHDASGKRNSMKRILVVGIASALACAACLSGCASQQESDAESSLPSGQPEAQVRTPADIASQSSDASGQDEAQQGTAQDGKEGSAMAAWQGGTAEVSIDGRAFAIELADNATAAAFANLLPLQVQMDELNGNEKYAFLDQALPSDPSIPGTIEAGDVMLYGDTCIVIFYETHSTSYAYTRIGRIADGAGLQAAVGAGSASASFSTA